MSMSLAQGGNGFPFFAESVYCYISGKSVDEIVVNCDDVPDHEAHHFLLQVV